MSKWISRYLKKFHTDNADITREMSVLSVPTISAPNKNNKSDIHIAGELNNYSRSTNSNFLNILHSRTDNTDSEWTALPKKKNEEHNNHLDMLPIIVNANPTIIEVKIVTCNQCKHFIGDKIGDGAGIGDCSIGIEWTQEVRGRLPLFRYAERHCNKFTQQNN